ncbi:MAG TPA: DUF4442 domain-containing protein [Saprospiraceae bacterium]|nr:DUF4442 domain-containing protein [Saprospiraceae bacterium]
MKAHFNQQLAKDLLRPWKLRLWMLTHLPMGLASGMFIEHLNEGECKVVLKDRIWIRNPFGSVFWAVMGMAAELSTGSLVYAWCSEHKIKFILTGIEGRFLKKVTGKSFYFCQSGQEVLRSIELLENPGDTSSVILPVTAHDQAGQKVAEFQFTWSLKIPAN